jgi:hypothetical protein
MNSRIIGIASIASALAISRPCRFGHCSSDSPAFLIASRSLRPCCGWRKLRNRPIRSRVMSGIS